MSDFNDPSSAKNITDSQNNAGEEIDKFVSSAVGNKEITHGTDTSETDSNRDSLNLEDFEKVDADQIKQMNTPEEEIGPVDTSFKEIPAKSDKSEFELNLEKTDPVPVSPSEIMNLEPSLVSHTDPPSQSEAISTTFFTTEADNARVNEDLISITSEDNSNVILASKESNLDRTEETSSKIIEELNVDVIQINPYNEKEVPSDFPLVDVRESLISSTAACERSIFQREATPPREPSPLKEPTPLKEPSPLREPTPIKEHSPSPREITPLREATPSPRELSPSREFCPHIDLNPSPGELSPAREISPSFQEQTSLSRDVSHSPRESTPVSNMLREDLSPRELSPARESDIFLEQVTTSLKDISPVREPSPSREIIPPKEDSLPRKLGATKEDTPPREPTPIMEITPPRDPTPPREPTPVKEDTPPRELPQKEGIPPWEIPSPKEDSPPRELTHSQKDSISSSSSRESTPPLEDTIPPIHETFLEKEVTSLSYESSVKSSFLPTIQETSVPLLSEHDTSKNSTENVKRLLSIFQPVVSLIYWRDVKKSGIVFGTVLVILLSLAYLSLISVVAYTSLSVLTGTIAFRIYKNIMQAVQKSQDGHPFKDYLELDTTLQSEKVHEATDILIAQVNSTVAELKRLFLVEDLIDSVKFGCLLWCLTYVGSWFNGLTLVILSVVALFTLPKVYEQNQTQIDQYIGMVRSQVNDVMTKVKAAVPIGNKEKAQ